MPLHSIIKSNFMFLDIIDNNSHSIIYILLKYIINSDIINMIMKIIYNKLGAKWIMLEYRCIIILNPQFNSFFNLQYCFRYVRYK